MPPSNNNRNNRTTTTNQHSSTQRDLSSTEKDDLAKLWLNHVPETDPSSPSSSDDSLTDITYSFLIDLFHFLMSLPLKSPILESLSPILEWNDDKATFPRIRLVESHVSIIFHHPTFHSAFDSFQNQPERGTIPAHFPSQPQQNHPSYSQFLHLKPEQALSSLHCAIGLFMSTQYRRQNPSSTQRMEQSLQKCRFFARFQDVQPMLRMSDIKTNMVGRFIGVRGHVTRAKPKCLRVLSADFQCCKCGEQFHHKFVHGQYSIPAKCVGAKCRSRSFGLLRSTAKYTDYQILKLQELQDETFDEAGRTPRQMEVELCGHDLVDICHAGDIVYVVGIVKPINTALAARKTGKKAMETSTYQLFLRGNWVSRDAAVHTNDEPSSPKNRRAGNEARKDGAVFDTTQLEKIIALAHSDPRVFSGAFRRAHPFHLLVRSICPSIVGHELVKAGIVLALLGGTTPPPSLVSTNPASVIRSNSHVLIVGDPGMGKSQMLLAATQIATRSVYVGGNTSSTTGLTVSLTKEAGGEAGIEAGALVLADQGICCIDEFDKMAKTHQDGLLEAMEQQQISIAKAGVVASLPARCSVIAAANPKHGTYNLNKTIAENIHIPSPLLSRFDLVFILRDRPEDNEYDTMVSSTIMDVYTRHQKTKGASVSKNHVGLQESFVGEDGWAPLEARLKYVAETQKEPLPADLVRDYISYARHYCHPKMTSAAAEVLKDYFMKLRHPNDNINPNETVPITTRQLEGLIRLSQARAKSCLREFVLEEDARDVVDLMSQSVKQVHTDELGRLERDRGGAGGRSKRKTKRMFVDAVRQQGRQNGMDRFTMEDLRWIGNKVSKELEGDVDALVDDLREQNDIIKNADGTYTLVK